MSEGTLAERAQQKAAEPVILVKTPSAFQVLDPVLVLGAVEAVVFAKEGNEVYIVAVPGIGTMNLPANQILPYPAPIGA